MVPFGTKARTMYCCRCFSDLTTRQVHFGAGSVIDHAGYACQQAAMISGWRKAFSAVPETTDPNFPFGITTLAGGCSEGFPLWSQYQHVTEASYTDCATGKFPRTSPMCIDMVDDWAGGLRYAQTGGYGHTPNAALSNVFIGQAYDHGEPCTCDRHALPPNGCWANGQCFGWTSPYSLNRTWNYQNSGIHPRAKQTVGQRLARAAYGLAQTPPKPQPTPKLGGCRVEGSRVVLSFDQDLLGTESVILQPKAPGELPMQLQVGPAVPVGPGNTSGWVYASTLEVLNGTSIAVTWPGGSTPTAIRYAWGNYPCCPGLDPETAFCPSAACPIATSVTKEPAVPFWAKIVNGRCHCDAPWTCDA